MSKLTITIDFDGVINSYKSGWLGHEAIIDDEPVPGAAEFLIESTGHFDVNVFGSRSRSILGCNAMRDYVREIVPASTLELIKFPDKKPAAFIGLDDRVLTFKGVWPSMEELRNFKPWYK